MEWSELRERVELGITDEQKEALRILNRRTALSLAPLVFSLLGATLGLRIRRGGRGVGVLLTLIVVIVYYLLSLMGESMARAGTVAPNLGPWLATIFVLGLTILFLFVNRVPFVSSLPILSRRTKKTTAVARTSQTKHRGLSGFGFPSLMDATLFRSLVVSFVVCFAALAAIFNIFTLFELWRFIAVTHAGTGLVARYLLFPDAADHCRTFSRDDVDLGTRDLRIASEKK
jgi:lipopolysaccharide export LptBFGC system permease protein LptF